MDPRGRARGPHSQGRGNDHCCPPADGTATPRGPGKPRKPGEAENDVPWGAGDASLPQGHPPPGPGSVSRRRGPVSLSSQGSRQGWRSPFWTPGWREARADAGTFLVVAFHKGSCYKVLSPLELENVSLPDSVTTPPGRIRAAGSSPARWYSGGVPPSTTRLPRSRPPPRAGGGGRAWPHGPTVLWGQEWAHDLETTGRQAGLGRVAELT